MYYRNDPSEYSLRFCGSLHSIYTTLVTSWLWFTKDIHGHSLYVTGTTVHVPLALMSASSSHAHSLKRHRHFILALLLHTVQAPFISLERRCVLGICRYWSRLASSSLILSCRVLNSLLYSEPRSSTWELLQKVETKQIGGRVAHLFINRSLDFLRMSFSALRSCTSCCSSVTVLWETVLACS